MSERETKIATDGILAFIKALSDFSIAVRKLVEFSDDKPKEIDIVTPSRERRMVRAAERVKATERPFGIQAFMTSAERTELARLDSIRDVEALVAILSSRDHSRFLDVEAIAWTVADRLANALVSENDGEIRTSKLFELRAGKVVSSFRIIPKNHEKTLARIVRTLGGSAHERMNLIERFSERNA
jgi:hypothetical protein